MIKPETRFLSRNVLKNFVNVVATLKEWFAFIDMTPIKYNPSTDKTNKNEAWNSFHPETWANFLKSFPSDAIKFVDVDSGDSDPDNDWRNPLNYWKNEEDTVVFELNLNTKIGKINPMSLVSLVRNTYADEFDYIELGEDKYLVRMWWD